MRAFALLFVLLLLALLAIACGRGSPEIDPDNDGVFGLSDNCPEVANEDQADADGDGYGDACDNCPDSANADQTDSDRDGVGNACEGASTPVRPVPTTSGIPTRRPTPTPFTRATYVQAISGVQSGMETGNQALLGQYPGAFTEGPATSQYLDGLLTVLDDATSALGGINPPEEWLELHALYRAAVDDLTFFAKVASADVVTAGDVPAFLESSGTNESFAALLAACQAILDAGGADAQGALVCNSLRPQ